MLHTKANIRRRNELLTALRDTMFSHNLEFAHWLGIRPITEWSAEEQEQFTNWYGTAPKFILDAIDNWGGLTPKQLEFAKNEFMKRLSTGRQVYESKMATRQAMLSRGIQWTPKRTQVTLEVVSVRNAMYGLKMLGVNTDGLKMWVSVPSGVDVKVGDRITMTVTVVPSDDPLFAFGKRPSKATVITK